MMMISEEYRRVANGANGNEGERERERKYCVGMTVKRSKLSDERIDVLLGCGIRQDTRWDDDVRPYLRICEYKRTVARSYM